MTFGGSSDAPSFWEYDYEEQNCYVVYYATIFSVYDQEDFKRCICDGKGNGEEDCPQESQPN